MGIEYGAVNLYSKYGQPSLDLQFSGLKASLTDRVGNVGVEFTRDSVGTYVDANGVIQTAAIDEARFDHDPVTGESLGLLIEEERTNSLKYSQNISSQLFTNGYSGGLIFPNSVVAPDGTLTGSKLAIVNGGTIAWWGTYNTSNSVTVVSGTTYTYSCFFKAGEISVVDLIGDLREGGGINLRATFTLTNSGSYSLSSGLSAGIAPFPNGWYRCWVTGTADASTGEEPGIIASYSGNGSDGFYAWGLQFEAGSFPTSYIPTPATFTSRASTATYYDANGVIQTAAIDVARDDTYFPDENGNFISAGLLLEEERTNTLLNSDNLTSGWNISAITNTRTGFSSPDGGTDASRLQEDTSSVSKFTYKAFTNALVVSNTYTLSVFVKAGERFRCVVSDAQNTQGGYFNLNTKETSVFNGSPTLRIVDVSDGWKRCSITYTPTSTTCQPRFYIVNDDGAVNYTGDGASGLYIWGAQLEEGSYPTSYIPTDGTPGGIVRAADISSSSTLARGADVASMTGTNFSSWYNQSEGTVYFDFDSYGKPYDNAAQVLSIRNSTPTEYIEVYTGNNSINAITLDVAAGRQFAFYTRNTVDNGKYALALQQDNFAVSKNGLTPLIDTNGSMTSLVDRVYIGGLGTNNQLNGTISRLTYWPTRLSDSDLQRLTE